MDDNDDDGDGDFDVETHGIRDDIDDDAMEARKVGDGDEDDTDDDVWEVEDGEEAETESDDFDISGYEGVSNEDNDELIQVREKMKAFKMQTDERTKRHVRKRKKEQARQSNDAGDGFKEIVKSYAIVNGFELWWKRSYKINTEDLCKEHDCSWRIYGNWTRKKEGFAVKIFTNEHTCSRVARDKKATYE
ncbi:serine/threonine-protein phosphatase 4 regulatory subunit 2-like [Punica granatum]|uniref:Serine/threonine-protein phosphatase 4 regulatory subunit 2-like n=2 Tax=Punica granatum TaxID=22663 RepID=A0A6P8E7N9_PUNGR|nr:serine/threonine-protein phosphatase 4 regulatory subunit 2-like [Punica granatum]PKI75933.1 hypothetical protein CRG98_003667 [Punica granatum]